MRVYAIRENSHGFEEVNNDLESLQKAINCRTIEAIRLCHNFYLLCDEEGSLKDLKIHASVCLANNAPYSVFGDFLIVNYDSEDFSEVFDYDEDLILSIVNFMQ